MRKLALMFVLSAFTAGCADVGLRDLRSDSEGPDEFGIAPVASLQEPENYTELPTPTPGGVNRADRSALSEGAAAFGGRLSDPNAPIPAADGALVQYASRLGVSPGIRETLAQADAEFRRRRSRLTRIRIVPVDRYREVYSREALDPQAERERWRNVGARTPSAPPAGQ
ncbi:DUF3035 domain-containing protein [Sulfitobacter sp.]|uniref:DUF3035 domain-containing protein n=1 Tax=Sulfitobacter sp. TaxID=1903071 RepID=UPI003299303B